MGEFFNRWRLTAELVALFLVFVAGYFTGGALLPPKETVKIVEKIEIKPIYLAKEEWDEHSRERHEQQMAVSEQLMEMMRAERTRWKSDREKWLQDRKLFGESRDDIFKLMETNQFKESFERTIEKIVTQRVSQREQEINDAK